MLGGGGGSKATKRAGKGRPWGNEWGRHLMWAMTTLRNPRCCVCQHPRIRKKLRATYASLRFQVNKLRNRPQIATAGLADDSPTVPSWNLTLPIAFDA